MLVLVLAMAGCAARGPASQPAAEGIEAGEATASGTATGGSGGVLMMGRSVMAGWFAHWGSDGTSPVQRSGRTLTYREIEGPEGIARSAGEAIGEAPPGSTVFFKFCFVDFNGGDAATARAELERNQGYVSEVVDAAGARGVHLIIGNALPKTTGETTPELVAEHKAYNSWLQHLTPGHDGSVGVFDMYGVLAGPNGALKPGYAIAPDDAHLTEAAYTALDAAFLPLLEAR
jgi:hypothetical protein